MRKLVVLSGFVSGVVAASVFQRRSFSRRPDRVDVYYGDGSMVSYLDGSPDAARLLPAAHDALAAVRG
jgi:hypothetical protein